MSCCNTFSIFFVFVWEPGQNERWHKLGGPCNINVDNFCSLLRRVIDGRKSTIKRSHILHLKCFAQSIINFGSSRFIHAFCRWFSMQLWEASARITNFFADVLRDVIVKQKKYDLSTKYAKKLHKKQWTCIIHYFLFWADIMHILARFDEPINIICIEKLIHCYL